MGQAQDLRLRDMQIGQLEQRDSARNPSSAKPTPRNAAFVESLRRVELFGTLCDEEELLQIADLGIIRRFPVGKAVYRVGERGEAVYVVFSGSVELVGRSESGGEFLLTIGLPDELFGDEALAEAPVRKTDAFAGSGTVVLEIPVAGLKRVLGEPEGRWAKVREFAASRELQRAVRQFSLLGDLSPEEVRQWFASCEMAHFETGQVVIRKGEKGGRFFIVASGRLGVFDSETPSDGNRLRTLGTGDFFGELEVLGGGARTATVVAEGPVSLASFGAEALRRTFANSPEVQARILEAVSGYRGQVPSVHGTVLPEAASELQPQRALAALPPGREGRGSQPGPPAQPNAGFWTALQLLGARLGPSLAAHRGLVVRALIFALLFSMAMQLTPTLTGRITGIIVPAPNAGTGSGAPSAVANFGMALVAGYLALVLVKAVFAMAREQVLNRLRSTMSNEVVGRVVERTFRLPLGFLRRTPLGPMMDVLDRAERVQRTLGETVVMLGVDLITLAVGLVWLFALDARLGTGLAWKTLLIVPLAAFFSYVSGKQMWRYQNAHRNCATAEKQLLAESFMGVATLKAMAAERVVWRRWFERFAHSQNAQSDMNRARAEARSLSEVATGLGMTVLFSFAIVFTLGADQGPIKVSDFVEFLTRVMLIFQPLESLMRTYPQLQEFAGDVSAVEELTQERTEQDAGNPRPLPLPEGRWSLKVENVTFSYLPGARPAVQGVSFEAQPGQMVAIVGRSGCGKTTLVSLLLHFYAPQQGRILVNDANIAELELTQYRRQLGVVLQETDLFSSTILENLTLGKPEAVQSEVDNAVAMAAARRLIQSRPAGYNEVLLEGARNLSGGERQRLAIARALLMQPRILIFDEATSALDNESERAIQKNMRAMAQDRVMIVIAHRLSTIRNADQILVMDQGRIVERGTHHELIERAGLYAHLLQESLT